MAEADPPADRERLCEQRDFLLASLDDLDAEYAAGDLDKRDYDELRDGYVGRAAEVLRALAVLDAAGEADADPPATNRGAGSGWPVPPRSSPWPPGFWLPLWQTGVRAR